MQVRFYLQAVLPVDEPSASDANAGSSSESNITLPTVLQELARGISSTEAERSASDSCVFVGYVKPLHERTPENISLPSSDQQGDVKVSVSFCVVAITWRVNPTLHGDSPRGVSYCVLPDMYLQKQITMRNDLTYSIILPELKFLYNVGFSGLLFSPCLWFLRGKSYS